MKRKIKYLIMFWILFVFIIIGGASLQGYFIYKKAVSENSLENEYQIMKKMEYYIPYEELPEIYKKAVIAVEDRRFFKHSGIDMFAIGRAFLHNIIQGRIVEGGSTITQQLARNLYFTQEKNIFRKLAEIFTAFEIESQYTKEEIFEWYANTIYFGEGYYGIGEACEGYYGKSIRKISDKEAMVLAGIPNAPSLYNPRANKILSKKRMLQVEMAMKNH